MERATRDLVDGGFGLGRLAPQELQQLFRLLRKVRLDADDFDDDLPRTTATSPRTPGRAGVRRPCRRWSGDLRQLRHHPEPGDRDAGGWAGGAGS